ncbi:pollen-specific leucine-rich repeat extensin-like protein 2 isoform X2 [Drosophila miranda]|uniref:pollen-specific leucine-rich repeat extensin-like protein 2 isoform X2 n=1 Tax=Drosophila miranda TaxID=7229 RepID=UPI00143FAB4C|nr:pollen-specific leucine-rich repeat extensin-like protein 2 isoform X2 [Drosophila miranda]
MHDVRNTRNKSDSERRASKAILIKPYYTRTKTIHSPPPRTLRTEEPAMNATENTPAKAHQRAAASAESPHGFLRRRGTGVRCQGGRGSRPKPAVAEEPHTSDGDMYADMELDADEAGSPSFEEEFEDAGSSQHSFPEPETPSYAPMFEQEFEDAGYHQRRDPRTGRGIYRPERGLERYTPKPYNAYYDDGESEEEEPYGRQFIAETETFHHTVTPWGLRVTRNHQMSVDVFVPPGRNVNAFLRTFREAAKPIDYRSEPAVPARASPPHAEARPPTPASDPPRCPNPPEESAAATPPHAEARPPTPASDPPRCPNPPEESAATTPTHAEAPHAEAAQGPPTEWPTGATEEGNAAPVRQAELTEPEEQWETGPDSGYPTMTLRRVKQPVAEETAPTPQTGEWEGQDELLVDCDLDEILRFLQDESTREGQSPADFSLIEELNQPTQWGVIALADWQVNIPGRALPAGLIEEIHQRLLEAERLRFRSWSWDQCYRVHKRSRAAPVCVDLLPEERGGGGGCNEP